MKFKKGDKVVCIDIKNVTTLILNKKYTIDNLHSVGKHHNIGISLTEIYGEIYFTCNFKLLSEVRKEKLKQLRNVI